MRITGYQLIHSFLLLSLPALALALAAQQAFAQDDEPALTVSGSLDVGAEHNSNVSITEIESATGESDTARLLDGSVSLQWQPDTRWHVESGANLSSRKYQDFGDFDLDMLMLYGDVSYDFDQFTLGGSHYHADAELGGDDFLVLKRSSAYIGKLLSNQFYLRGSINLTGKAFDNLPQRDADSEGLGLDAFWFFNQGQSSLSLGYAYDEEDAQDNAYSYDANTLRVRYNNRFQLGGHDSDLQLGLRTQFRDYQGITPSIGRPRDDRQYVADARLNVSLTAWLGAFLRAEHGDYRSRLDSADYDENRFSAGFKLEF